ncbi:unnamed protein product [Gordionus sp. m RMFG-2023]|uniref:ATP-dependent RNA helicase DDX19A-like n=1 Tax=Gordionus sp. m RMFG-2023 TaxID=3053472 RepID=UPI0030E2954A
MSHTNLPTSSQYYTENLRNLIDERRRFSSENSQNFPSQSPPPLMRPIRGSGGLKQAVGNFDSNGVPLLSPLQYPELQQHNTLYNNQAINSNPEMQQLQKSRFIPQTNSHPELQQQLNSQFNPQSTNSHPELQQQNFRFNQQPAIGSNQEQQQHNFQFNQQQPVNSFIPNQRNSGDWNRQELETNAFINGARQSAAFTSARINPNLKPESGFNLNNSNSGLPRDNMYNTFLNKMDDGNNNPAEARRRVPSFGNSSQSAFGERDEDSDPAKFKADNSFLTKLLRNQLQNPNKNVEVLRADVHHPLHSVYSFEALDLSPELLRGVYAMNFSKPSKIQEMALPLILSDPKVNLIAQSQSGTGKTAAYSLGVLSKLNLNTSNPPSNISAQALILAPTYELALQIGEAVKQIGRYMPGLKVAYAVKKKRAELGYSNTSNPFDMSNTAGGDGLNSNFNKHDVPGYTENLDDYEIVYPRGKLVQAHVVVGTPGSVVDWIRFGMIDAKAISIFVLDEADVMIDQQGHRAASVRIHKYLDKQNCQFLLFSATYEENEVMSFASELVPEPSVVLRLKREEETLDNIAQYYVPCLGSDAAYLNPRDRMNRETIFAAKMNALCLIYSSFPVGQCVVFCESKREAVMIARALVEDCGHGAVALLTSDLTVDQRAAVIRRFKSGEDERVLVATNVLARGIDIESVSLVINFGVPRKFVENPNSETGAPGTNNFGDNSFYATKAKGIPTSDPDYETYLHRIGRTGRFGRNGLSFILIDTDSESSEEYHMVKALENFYKRTITKCDPNNLEGDVEKL